jgi:hypothetical protein
MSLKVSTPFVSEAGHWYTRDGVPRYTVIGANGKERNTTLRDARKEGLVPSVTTILKVAANPVLNQWIQKQVLMAALTLAKLDGESEEDYINRIIVDSKKQGKDAADVGTDIHNAIQAFYEGEKHSAYTQHREGCVRALEDVYGGQKWISELSFGHEMGFGGKCDLHSTEGDGIVVDIKTKDFDDPEKVDGYDEHLMQLAAYRVGLRIPNARCGNVFVSRSVPGLAVVKEWSAEDLERGWLMFYNLLRFWQIKNGHE